MNIAVMTQFHGTSGIHIEAWQQVFTFMALTIPLTDRLLFEPLTLDHADELAGLTEPAVTKHIGGEPNSIDQLRLTFTHMIEGPKDPSTERWINIVLRDCASGEAIGRVEATVDLTGETYAEIAFLLIPSQWGKGFAFEAMSAFETALAGQIGVRCFWAAVEPRNHRSVSLLRRLGYSESPASHWPRLRSYDDGDFVFAKAVAS